MKLFLTSAGLSNNSLIQAFNKMIGLPIEKIHIAFIPTAANVENGDKGWLISDLENLKRQGYGCIDIVDISALPQTSWQPRLEKSNVLFFSGGNTAHLMHWIEKSGLKKLLPELLKTRVYAGISAGSCVAGPTIDNPVQDLYEENVENVVHGLGLVNFQFVAHLNSPYFDRIRNEKISEASKKIREAVYVADDETAVAVVDGDINIVSEGEFLILNS